MTRPGFFLPFGLSAVLHLLFVGASGQPLVVDHRPAGRAVPFFWVPFGQRVNVWMWKKKPHAFLGKVNLQLMDVLHLVVCLPLGMACWDHIWEISSG